MAVQLKGLEVDRPTTFNPDNLQLFWEFITERQKIWYDRFVQKLSPPWTADPILQKNKFTNIYRELDPGTIFVMNNILNVDEELHNRIFNVMIYRLMCSIPTYRQLGFQRVETFDYYQVLDVFEEISRSDRPVFGNAYLISPYSSMGSPFKYINVARLFHLLRNNFGTFFRRLDESRTLGEAYMVINSQYGFGPFLAYQICVDLLYPIRREEGRSVLPFSVEDFVRLGPGAVRGFSRLSIRTDSTAQVAGIHWLRANQLSEFERLNLAFQFLNDSVGRRIEISLANLQNCLCEFHKYMSIREGTGKAQRIFVPSSKTIIVDPHQAGRELERWLGTNFSNHEGP